MPHTPKQPEDAFEKLVFEKLVAEKRGILARAGHVLVPILFEESEVRDLLASHESAVRETEWNHSKPCLCGTCLFARDAEIKRLREGIESKLVEKLTWYEEHGYKCHCMAYSSGISDALKVVRGEAK